MRILDRYVTKKVGLSYLLILAVFVGLYLISDLFTNLGDFLNAKIPINIVIEYYINLLPFIFLNTSAFALSIAIAFTLGGLNKTNELICMRASGVSIVRISAPILILSLLLSFCAFFLQEKVLIHSQKKSEDIKIDYIKNPGKQTKVEKNIVFYNNNKLFIAAKFLPKYNTLENVIILKEKPDGTIKEQMIATNLIYNNNNWTAYNVMEYELNEDGKIIDQPVFWQEHKIDLDEKPRTILIKSSSRKSFLGNFVPLELNMLRKKIESIKKMEMSSSTLLRRAIVQYHSKIATPLAHLFLAMGILPFTLEIKKRKANLLSIVWGILFGVLYFTIFSISLPLGKAGIIIPQISCWLAPLFFCVMGISGIVLLR